MVIGGRGGGEVEEDKGFDCRAARVERTRIQTLFIKTFSPCGYDRSYSVFLCMSTKRHYTSRLWSATLKYTPKT